MVNDNLTILEVLKKSEEFLRKKNIASSKLDAELILADILEIPRIKLYVNFDKKLTQKQIEDYRNKIVSRGQNQPVAYIIQKKDFLYSTFFVNKNVLIPRPETEELVEWCLENDNTKKVVLDLCSGSGCIAISLKKERKNWEIFASDISNSALEVFKINSAKILSNQQNGDNIDSIPIPIFESNLFDQIPDHLKFDIIISNPPYIPVSQKYSIQKDVLNYEPELALFLENPEEFFHSLISQAFLYLKEDGMLYLETNSDNWETLIEISKKYKFKNHEIKKDYSQKNRFIKFIK